MIQIGGTQQFADFVVSVWMRIRTGVKDLYFILMTNYAAYVLKTWQINGGDIALVDI
jgi:hypothetical protein